MGRDSNETPRAPAEGIDVRPAILCADESPMWMITSGGGSRSNGALFPIDRGAGRNTLADVSEVIASTQPGVQGGDSVATVT